MMDTTGSKGSGKWGVAAGQNSMIIEDALFDFQILKKYYKQRIFGTNKKFLTRRLGGPFCFGFAGKR